MTKLRFYYWIFSILAVLFFVVLVVIDPENAQAYFILEVGIIFINFYLKRKEKNRLLKITMIYINECNPERYLYELEQFNKKRIRSKHMLIMDKISKSLIYLDIGKIEESYKILFSLVEVEPSFNTFMRFWYYKSWIYYYEEVKEIKRMKYLIDKTTELIELSPLKYRNQLQANFKQILARYYVTAGIYLDNAEDNYSEVFKGRFPKLTVVLSVYYLGVIAYKQGKYDLAVERLQSVVRNGKYLFVSEKSKVLLEKISNSAQSML